MKIIKSIEEQRSFLNRVILSEDVKATVLEHWPDIIQIIPELKPMEGFVQNNPYHIYDVLTHTLVVMSHLPNDLLLRMSALFHDSGKPHTYTVDANGIGHFYGHEQVSLTIARKALTHLAYGEEFIEDVLELIRYHDYSLHLSEKSLKKLVNKMNIHLLDPLFELKKADCKGQNPAYVSRLELINSAYEMIRKL